MSITCNSVTFNEEANVDDRQLQVENDTRQFGDENTQQPVETVQAIDEVELPQPVLAKHEEENLGAPAESLNEAVARKPEPVETELNTNNKPADPVKEKYDIDLIAVAEQWQQPLSANHVAQHNAANSKLVDELDNAEEAVNTAPIEELSTNQKTNAAEPFSLTKELRQDPFDEHELMFQNIKAMLDATSEEADADVENKFIPIDPYYTIDYFASQGIKLDLEHKPARPIG